MNHKVILIVFIKLYFNKNIVEITLHKSLGKLEDYNWYKEIDASTAYECIQNSETLRKANINIDYDYFERFEFVGSNSNVKVWNFELDLHYADDEDYDLNVIDPKIPETINQTALVYFRNTLMRHGKIKQEYEVNPHIKYL